MSVTTINLDLPMPPSVNRIRRIDWAGHNKHKDFRLRADLTISAAYAPNKPPRRQITGTYELEILIPERSRLDLDNCVKCLIDYLVAAEFVPDDDRRYLRGYSVRWAPIPACRVTIKGKADATGELVDIYTRRGIKTALGKR
jgi:Holliday junction resolvase RusA-like endonuclease